MDPTRSSVTLSIDGHWSADDFRDLFGAISNLYSTYLIVEELHEHIRDLDEFYNDFIGRPRTYWRWPYPRTAFLEFGTYFPPPLPTLDRAGRERLAEQFAQEQRLLVARVSYASPGFTDLTGIGAIIGHIKDFVIHLLDTKERRRTRELNEEKQALENESLRLSNTAKTHDIEQQRIENVGRKLANAQGLVKTLQDIGYSKREIRALLSDVDENRDVLARLIDERKLLSIASEEREAPNGK